VGSLARTMTKIMHLGLSPAECVRRVTSAPADFFSLKGLGHLRVGDLGDLTIFRLVEAEADLVDSKGVMERASRQLTVESVVVGGRVHQLA